MKLAALCLAFLLVPQERFPTDDHCWLRFKTGTWIKSRMTVDAGGTLIESVLKLRLAEKSGETYVIEETTMSEAGAGRPYLNRTASGTKTGSEPVKVGDKEIPCTIWTAKGVKDDGPTETKYWMPADNKVPLKIVFKQQNSEGEMTAVALDEKMKVGDRTFTCSKLAGKLKHQGVEGTMTVWAVQEIPGAQVRMDLSFDTPNGVVKIRIEASEIHEEK